MFDIRIFYGLTISKVLVLLKVMILIVPFFLILQIFSVFFIFYHCDKSLTKSNSGKKAYLAYISCHSPSKWKSGYSLGVKAWRQDLKWMSWNHGSFWLPAMVCSAYVYIKSWTRAPVMSWSVIHGALSHQPLLRKCFTELATVQISGNHFLIWGSLLPEESKQIKI